MKFEIAPLPFAKDALAPFLSARTLSFHYDKHHKGYLRKLEQAVRDTALAKRSLEQIVLECRDQSIFNVAAQVWNHTFYWNSLTPPLSAGKRTDAAPTEPKGALREAVERDFGKVAKLRAQLAEAANGEFGSGWAWLLADPSGRLSVQNSDDADNPLASSSTALLTIDVWEHAYYLDYQNERAKYVEAVIDHLLNWDFAERNYTAARHATGQRRRDAVPERPEASAT